MSQWNERLGTATRDLYLRVMGSPSREARFEVGDQRVEILKWDPDQNPEEVALYATVGGVMTSIVAENHRVEYFLGLLPAEDEVARSMALLATHAERHGAFLDAGHTVRFQQPLWPGTTQAAFLILKPLEAIFPVLQIDGLHVEFLQAIPAYEDEATEFRRLGPYRFMERWEQADVAFWDPHRSAH